MNRVAKRVLVPAAAVIALAYLIVMVVTGAMPENRQLIQFKAAGVLEQTPASITRVALTANGASFVFVRRASGWATESGNNAVTAVVAATLERALKIMRNSKPVRVLTPDEIADAGPGEFGLDHPRISVTLGDSGGVVLEAEFGASNTDGILQFMRLKGKDQLYLMSDFVGQEWEKVAAAGKTS